jgi:menaquinone-dependent protoporphyrinogen oxidase
LTCINWSAGQPVMLGPVARVLIVHASVEGQAAQVAAVIAGRLGSAGHRVDLRDAAAGFDVAACDALVIGASVHYGSHPRWLRAALRHGRPALVERPGAFFSVSLSANPDYARSFLRQAGWQPQVVASFAGALKYSRYGWFKRRVVQAFARMGGHSTDVSRDHDYTDWAAVGRFADDFASLLAKA